MRRGRAMALAGLVGAVGALAAVGLLGRVALQALKDPQVGLVHVSPTQVTWGAMWTAEDNVHATVALCSPWHRGAVLARLNVGRRVEQVSVFDESQMRRLIQQLEHEGRCAESARFAFAAGLLPSGEACGDPSAQALTLEAEFGARGSDIIDGRDRNEELVQRWSARPSIDLRGPELYDLVSFCHRSGGSQARCEYFPHEVLRCVARVARQSYSDFPWRDPRPAAAPAFWDELLQSASPACRILGATRRNRRDDASLRALDEIAGSVSPTWRPLLDAARDLIVLEGARTGALRHPPSCARQAPHGATAPAQYAAMPGVALELLRATEVSSCQWMVERIRLPAQEGLVRFAIETGGAGTSVSERGGGWELEPYPRRSFGVGPEWFPYAWQGYQMALASRAHAAVRDPRFDVAWEQSLREGLDRVRRDGVRLAVRLRSGHWWVPTPGSDNHQGFVEPLGLVEVLDRLAAQVAWTEVAPAFGTARDPARDVLRHADDLPLPLRTALLQRGAMTASALAGALGKVDGDPEVAALRTRAYAAASTGDALRVLDALGEPSEAAVRALADLAPLVTRNRDAVYPWLRVSQSFSRPWMMSLLARMRFHDAIVRTLRVLALDATPLAYGATSALRRAPAVDLGTSA